VATVWQTISIQLDKTKAANPIEFFLHQYFKALKHTDTKWELTDVQSDFFYLTCILINTKLILSITCNYRGGDHTRCGSYKQKNCRFTKKVSPWTS